MPFGGTGQVRSASQILPATGDTCHHHEAPWNAELDQQTCNH